MNPAPQEAIMKYVPVRVGQKSAYSGKQKD
jgi:hypothetical protein